MDTKSQAPNDTDGDDNNLDTSAVPSTESAPLVNYDFDRQLDPAPATPGPLLKQPSMATGKPAKQTKKIWVILIALLVVVLAGGTGYFYWQTTEIQKQADAAHQDAFNFYVENVKLKANAEKTTEPKEPTAAEQKAADKTAITDVVTAKLHAPTKDKDVKLTVNVMKQNTQFAYVNAGPASGGAAAYILKKVADEWTIIYSGQEKVSAEVVEQYTIPTEFQSGQ